ncbi:hypothetical protein AUR64_02925 [Haloprofundus marisrubri]|uniref:Twin-arginine translocation signal domain-containing protein n=1 Tax=Haloprofundus marisrubri TaxID=1514971 RepID=A0A0W1R324_9EURY|nr:twin-arginine translocation signal domain-containing protein [Haloprofundus marisrubri]KTG07627.1 hypothetical protein AUR64_02925 [Haloprofundus marisrubri]
MVPTTNTSESIRSTNTCVSRRAFLRASTALVALGVLGGVSSDSAVAQSGNQVFVGTQVTDIDTIDPLSGQSLGIQSFQQPATFIASAPVSDGVSVETNPFNLVAGADDKGAPGAVDVWSAAVAEVPSDPSIPNPNPGPLLLQYWNIQGNQQLTEFSGTLVNSHRDKAVAPNLINAPTVIAPGIPPLPFPKAIAEGAVLQGITDGTAVTMFVQGTTVDGANPFISRIDATRVQ